MKKSLSEYGDKIGAEDKTKIEAAMKEAEDAVRGSDKDEIEKKTKALAQASHKLAEQMYRPEQAKATEGGEQAAAGGGEAKD